MRPTPRFRHHALASLAGLCLLAASCSTTFEDPVLLIETPGGRELGVSTDYGVVFLGSTAQSGEVDLISFFADGPSAESSVIEPVGGGLYTASTEIRLPLVRMNFAPVEPGSKITLMGRRGLERWERELRVASDPRVQGMLLPIPKELENAPDQIGTGLYVQVEDEMQLIGLVSGRLRLESEQGTVDYLTVMGPTDLWRLVALKREDPQRTRWVYRGDIL